MRADVIVTSSEKHMDIAENIVDSLIDAFGSYHTFIIICEMMNVMACGQASPMPMLQSFAKTLECKMRDHAN